MPERYDSIRDDIATGDIVLFAGRGAASRLIQLGTRSRWSHVDLAVRFPDLDYLALWESTTLSKVPDADTGQRRKGVMVVPLSERVRTYHGTVAYRHLEQHRDGAEVLASRAHMAHAMMTLRRELAGRPYEASRLELVLSALRWLPVAPGALDTLFCSELVAAALAHVGVMDDALPANAWSPAELAGPGLARHLRPGWRYRDPIEITP